MEGQAASLTVDSSIIEKEEHIVRFKARLLLVEDIPANQKVALAMLTRFGCEVDIVENGEEAVKRLCEQAYDLVLMDCHLPAMDGFEATHLIRNNEQKKMKQTGSGFIKRVPIVAMMASISESDRERCLSGGMDDYLTKPISRNKLQEVLKKMLLPSNELSAGAVHKVVIAVENSKESHFFEKIISNFSTKKGSCRPSSMIPK